MQRPTTSISRSSHLLAVACGRTPGVRLAISCARVSATEILGSSEVMKAQMCGVREANAETSGVAGLDGAALLFHADRIVLQRLDLLERYPARLLFCLRVRRTQTADIDDKLLNLAAEAERLEQLCRVRVGRTLEDAVGADDCRRSFRCIDRLHRPPSLPQLQNIVFVAIGHHRALAEFKLLR